MVGHFAYRPSMRRGIARQALQLLSHLNVKKMISPPCSATAATYTGDFLRLTDRDFYRTLNPARESYNFHKPQGASVAETARCIIKCMVEKNLSGTHCKSWFT